MLILGIETSCDETSVALVEDGMRILSSDVASQIRLHEEFGGVVPELASRAHIQLLIPMIDQMLFRHGLKLHDVDALAVTLGPGLVGALLVGVETAKALAFAAKKPLIPVHHIAGHLYSPFLYGEGDAFRLVVIDEPGITGTGKNFQRPESPEDRAQPGVLQFPYLGLVVSGGHTSLVRVESPMKFEVIGETVDDAAGEAFDKLAKLLKLGYPGGPQVEKTAVHGNPTAYDLPRPMTTRQHGHQFSFSGLKTAAVHLVNKLGGAESVAADQAMVADICASFQEAVADVLISKAKQALKETGYRFMTVAGGVACNGYLRRRLREELSNRATIVIPAPALCTDNAAMIAGLAYHHRDLHAGALDLTLNATASLSLGPVPAAARMIYD